MPRSNTHYESDLLLKTEAWMLLALVFLGFAVCVYFTLNIFQRSFRFSEKLREKVYRFLIYSPLAGFKILIFFSFSFLIYLV